VHAVLKRDPAFMAISAGVMLCGLATGAALHNPVGFGIALMLSLAVAASVGASGQVLTRAPVRARTDLKTLGDTR